MTLVVCLYEVIVFLWQELHYIILVVSAAKTLTTIIKNTQGRHSNIQGNKQGKANS